MSEVTDVFTFLDTLTGYQSSMIIMAAERLSIFGALGTKPRAADDLAAELNLDSSALAAMLGALAGIGLVELEEDGFSQTAFAEEYLGGGTDLALVVQKEEYFARAWLALDEVVRSGRPVLDTWCNRVKSQAATVHMFLDALNVLAEHTGPRVWELPELAPGKRVLDVGGGFGYYTRRIVEAGSTVILVDLPEIIAVLEDRFADLPTASVELVSADLAAEASCGVAERSVDAALVSHLLHDLSVNEGIDLLRAVRSALVPGGTVVVNDFARDVGPGAFGPLFDVMMRVETGGAAHPLATLRSMIESAGFGEVSVLDLPEPLTVIKGRRI